MKVLDSGLAKIVELGLASEGEPIEHEATVTMWATQPNVVVGTLGAMEPEQVRAQAVDARTDVFAFGVVVYEMLSIRHPFRREAQQATLSAILEDTPPPLTPSHPDIPATVDVVLRRCLAVVLHLSGCRRSLRKQAFMHGEPAAVRRFDLAERPGVVVGSAGQRRQPR